MVGEGKGTWHMGIGVGHAIGQRQQRSGLPAGWRAGGLWQRENIFMQDILAAAHQELNTPWWEVCYPIRPTQARTHAHTHAYARTHTHTRVARRSLALALIAAAVCL